MGRNSRAKEYKEYSGSADQWKAKNSTCIGKAVAPRVLSRLSI